LNDGYIRLSECKELRLTGPYRHSVHLIGAFELVLHVREQPVPEVAGNRIELLFLLPQLLVEFLGVV